MARRYPEVRGLISWVTPVYQARAEVVNSEEGDILNTSFSSPWETWTSSPSNPDGRMMIKEANIPGDFAVLGGS